MTNLAHLWAVQSNTASHTVQASRVHALQARQYLMAVSGVHAPTSCMVMLLTGHGIRHAEGKACHKVKPCEQGAVGILAVRPLSLNPLTNPG